MGHWHRLSRESVDALSLGPGRMVPWAESDQMVGNPAHSRRLELNDLQGPFQPSPFCDSVIRWMPLPPAEKTKIDQVSFSWAESQISVRMEIQQSPWMTISSAVLLSK